MAVSCCTSVEVPVQHIRKPTDSRCRRIKQKACLRPARRYNTGKFIRLLRAVGLQRRCRGSPFRWVDLISTRRKEFSYSARRLVAASAYTFLAVHYFSCLIWWTIRLQDYPSITWPVEQGLVQVAVKLAPSPIWTLGNIQSSNPVLLVNMADYVRQKPRPWAVHRLYPEAS